MTLMRRLRPGGIDGPIPAWYAVAYSDFDTEEAVCYPIPLHFLVRWYRDLICWCRCAGRPGFREGMEIALERRGRELGWKAAMHHIESIYGSPPDLQAAYGHGYAAYDRGYQNGYRKGQGDAGADLLNV